MITSLIKQATINLAPEVEETKDGFDFSDPIEIDEANEDDEEDVEDDEEDEEDEEDECDCDKAAEIYLETTVDEIGLNDSLETIGDSQVLIDFIEEVFYDLDKCLPNNFFSIKLDDLYFIYFNEQDDSNVVVTVDLGALERYLNK